MAWKHQIPELYREILPPEFLEADLNESAATCGDCAMTREKRGPRARLTYEAQLKCCTFEPFLPNFLVGAVLKHESRFPRGVREIRRKIATREGALPIGLVPALPFQVEFNARKPGDFGNRGDWICPYYQTSSNNCGLWKYRGSVCTTFFCQSDDGASGKRFWSQMLDYLSLAEMALMEEVLVELGFSPRQVSECLEYVNRHEASAEELASSSLSKGAFKRLWNGEENHIEDFYRTCYEKACQFDRSRFQESIGETGARLEKKLRNRLQRRLDAHDA